MSAARVSIRYAKAFVGALEKSAEPDQEIAAFAKFCQVVREQEELRSVFANVTLRPGQKIRVLQPLAEKLQISGTTLRFLEVLAKHDRLAILDHVEAAVKMKVDEKAGIQDVVLKTATPLEKKLVTQFATKMEDVLKSKVRVKTQVQEGLIGGGVAEVGSLVFDGSVKGRLNRLRRELVKEY